MFGIYQSYYLNILYLYTLSNIVDILAKEFYNIQKSHMMEQIQFQTLTIFD